MAETREPKPGDVIWANRIVKGRPYNHCGIYEGGGRVIHFAAPQGAEISQENAVVHRTSLDHFADGCPVKIIEYAEGFSSEETLRRARSRIGERGYDFLTNNCDHFATACKTGEHHSLQVDEAKKVIRVVSTAVGGPVGAVGEILCTAHDIAEDFKAPKLDSNDSMQKPQEIRDRLDFNTAIAGHIIPVPEESPEEGIPFPYEPKELLPFTEPPVEYVENEPEEEILPDEDASPKKAPLYERIGEKLKSWTYPIAGALEVLKRTGKLPPFMQNVDYNTLGARVRNGIDKIVTTIKVITGKITPQGAVRENKNNETALLGQQVAREHKQPVKEVVTQTFGKVGTVIKHAAQQAVTAFVPAPVRQIITTGFQKVGRTMVSGIKAAAQKTGPVLKAGLGKVASIFGFGR
jgi:hypothetical protein